MIEHLFERRKRPSTPGHLFCREQNPATSTPSAPSIADMGALLRMTSTTSRDSPRDSPRDPARDPARDGPRDPSRPEPLWREATGRVLRRHRHERGERLTETATRAGVSTQYLSEIERGRKDPSSEILAAVAGALDLTLLDLTAEVVRDLQAARSPRLLDSRLLGSRLLPGQPLPGPDAGRTGGPLALAG